MCPRGDDSLMTLKSSIVHETQIQQISFIACFPNKVFYNSLKGSTQKNIATSHRITNIRFFFKNKEGEHGMGKLVLQVFWVLAHSLDRHTLHT